jgi:riboflavin kinase/FMN adenylyltransferase
MITIKNMRVFPGHPVLPASVRGGVYAMGSFDGMHPGHQAVIELARQEAKRRGALLGIIVLEPLPREHFQPENIPLRITTREQRRHLASELGVDVLVELSFDEYLSKLSDREFCRDVIARDIGASCLAVGFDFNFGKGRVGNLNSLRAFGAEDGFDVVVADRVTEENGDKASSTHIRDKIRQGHMEEAATLLGRVWEIEAEVEGGEKRGRTIGFPTANMKLGPLIHPRHGVYATRIQTPDGIWRDSVANFGRTPTTGLRAPVFETHIFDFDGDLYGQILRVQLIKFLRDELHFDSLQDLIDQMHRDSAEAKEILARIPAPVA